MVWKGSQIERIEGIFCEKSLPTAVFLTLYFQINGIFRYILFSRWLHSLSL